MALNAEEFVKRCAPLFQGSDPTLDGWFRHDLDSVVWDELCVIDERPMSHAALDQVLIMSGLPGVNRGFFRFYWVEPPTDHPHAYGPDCVIQDDWSNREAIVSTDHFVAGWTRFYIDALMYFGDIERGFGSLSHLSGEELVRFFDAFKHDYRSMTERVAGVVIEAIPRDDRFLIGETACKTLEGAEPIAVDTLLAAYDALGPWDRSPSFKELVQAAANLEIGADGTPTAYELDYVTDEFTETLVTSREVIEAELGPTVDRFNRARSAALANTRRYLSLAGDLDVYVATSMRRRDDYRQVAHLCEQVFSDANLMSLNVSYFDPTLSAASGHEDKGLVECLMVRSAKALVYIAGAADSWGKDSEAAMALSLGKPVIFFASEETRKKIFDDIHPLTRLISFDRGVPVGAMVVPALDQVVEILHRVFANALEYRLRNDGDDRHLRLEELVSGSVVRLQSQDRVLRVALREAYRPR